MRLFLILISLFLGWVSFAADAPYAVAAIQPALLKNANVIKRSEEIYFTIHNLKRTSLTHKYALTILNAKGDKHSYFVEWYDKLREINSIEGVLYDATGKAIKKLKAKDIQDVSAVNNISLMDDNRRKEHSFHHNSYPYTIEYEVSVTYNHTFHFPGWMPQNDEHIAVEKSMFSVTYPADYLLRYKVHNYGSNPVKTENKQNHTLFWHVQNQPAIIVEKHAPGWSELTTNVSIAPTNFEVQGYQGNMTSWKEFGKFFYELAKDHTQLPQAVKEKVSQLIMNVNDDKEKVKILYNYLQQNTRYISIQLGLGGWQPYDAEYVAKNGYGDCKALSNYMHSLLIEAKIASYYTLIKAGENAGEILDDFPSNQFNHAILCVPLQKDTLWLECTSQTSASGYMGGFTGNRKALLISEVGGTLVNTPAYTLTTNTQLRTVQGKIDEEGNLEAKAVTRYNGLQQDDLHGMIHQLSKDKLKEILQDAFQIGTYNITGFAYKEQKSEQPQITEDISLYAADYAAISGKRMFVTPNIFNRSSYVLPIGEPRLQEIIINYEYRDIDSVFIQIPKGYEPESIPKEIKLKSEFGSYSISTLIKQDSITFVRIREQYSGRHAVTKYQSLAAYFLAIKTADQSRIVFVKKQ